MDRGQAPTTGSIVRTLALAATFMTIGVAQALSVVINISRHETCSYGNGRAEANATGGLPPYSYLWSTGATTQQVTGLSAGPLSVTVTDFEGTQASANGTVNSTDYQLGAVSGGSMCPGDPYGGFGTTTAADLAASEAGSGPFTFLTPFLLDTTDWGDTIYHAFTSAPPGTPVIFQFTDAGGCPGTMGTMALGQPVWTTPVILDVQGACGGTNTGVIQALVQHSPVPAWTYHQLTDGAGSVFDPDGSVVGQGQGSTGHTFTNNYDVMLSWAGLAPGDYWITQTTTYPPFGNWYPNGGCGDSVMVTVPDLGSGCAHVGGRVFMDPNEDCQYYQGYDPPVPSSLFLFEPGPYFATSNIHGQYGSNLPVGTYTVTQIAADLQQHCLVEPITADATSQVVLDFADTSLVPLDVQVSIASGAARPGFELHYAIDLVNLTNGLSGPTQVLMTYDPALTFISASSTPTSSGGGTVTWNNLAGPNAFGQTHLLVRFQIPSDVSLIGSVLAATATATTGNTDAVPVNNTAAHAVTITTSFDPNDKTATTSSGSSNSLYYIDQDEWMDYTIRFQNTGSDTAFIVVITDTLPATLDPATIQWGAASHACARNLSGQGLLTFVFPNIQLPDSNVNEPASHGFVSFRIRPRLPLLPGTVITNAANIFFDFNPAVITEPSILTAEFSTGLVAGEEQGGVRLFPNPVHDQLCVSLPWNELPGICTVRAADGREVMRFLPAGPTFFIDARALPAGVYSLHTPRSAAIARFIKL